MVSACKKHETITLSIFRTERENYDVCEAQGRRNGWDTGDVLVPQFSEDSIMLKLVFIIKGGVLYLVFLS